MSLLVVSPDLQALIQIGIEMLVTFLVTQLIKSGFDFSGYKSQIVAGAVSAVLVLINSLLAKVPATYEGIGAAIMNLIVVALGSFAVHQVYKQITSK